MFKFQALVLLVSLVSGRGIQAGLHIAGSSKVTAYVLATQVFYLVPCYCLNYNTDLEIQEDTRG